MYVHSYHMFWRKNKHREMDANFQNSLISDLVRHLKTHCTTLFDGELNSADLSSLLSITHIGVTFVRKLDTLNGIEKKAVLLSAMKELSTSDLLDTTIPLIIDYTVTVSKDKQSIRLSTRACDENMCHIL